MDLITFTIVALYILFGLCLGAYMIYEGSEFMDVAEEIAAMTVLALFWPIAVLAMWVLAVNEWWRNRGDDGDDDYE